MIKKKPNFNLENLFWSSGVKFVVGIDEAGVGPVAGPVVAVAVILKPNTTLKNIPKVRDSKMISPATREKLYKKIIDSCQDYGIGICSSVEVDKLNIYNATLLAMKRAVLSLKKIEIILIDGIHTINDINFIQLSIVKGDQKIASISSASILAKVTRDNIMLEYSRKYPEYGFEKHKGYFTKMHINAINKYGLTPIHRKSFLKNYI